MTLSIYDIQNQFVGEWRDERRGRGRREGKERGGEQR